MTVWKLDFVNYDLILPDVFGSRNCVSPRKGRRVSPCRWICFGSAGGLHVFQATAVYL